MQCTSYSIECDRTHSAGVPCPPHFCAQNLMANKKHEKTVKRFVRHGVLELSSVVMSTCHQKLLWLCKWSNKKACEKRNAYSKIYIKKRWCTVFFPRFISLSQILVTLFLSFFVPGNKDIVLELLSTMTNARDIAFVDKVRNYFKNL